MKCLALILIGIVVYVWGEGCRRGHPRDCDHEVCGPQGSSWHVVCITNNTYFGVCTCADGPDPSQHGNGTACGSQRACTHPTSGSAIQCGAGRSLHCVDHFCRCIHI